MKHQLRNNLILSLALAVCAVFLITLVTADSRANTKAGTLVVADPTVTTGLFAASVEPTDTTITSPVYNTEFPFNALAAQWEQDGDFEFDLLVRFKKESWTEWQPLERAVDFRDDMRNDLSTQLLLTPYTNIFQYQLIFSEREHKELVRDLAFTYIDSTKGQQSYQIATASSSDQLRIVSRREWGADESYQYNEAGQLIWEPEYYTPKKFVIHHTASSKVDNPAATVRAIYYWHAKSNGWGDIGYNYLIDSNGVIYEGRAGGDGVVGGHAYMNNRNTIGIAMIGCYDSKEKECSSPGQVTPAALDALERLIAAKSQLFDIAPAGKSSFNTHGILANVIGHTDVGSTYCPGDRIYEQLGLIKDQAKSKLAQLPALPTYETSAQLVSVSEKNVAIPQGETATVRVSFKNTGQATWRGYQDNGVLVGTDVKKLGKINGLRFASHNPVDVSGFIMNEGNVGPGEIATFDITLPAVNDTHTFTLAWNKMGYFPATDFTVTTNVVATSTGTTSAPAPQLKPTYLALLEQSTLPERIPANTSQEALLKFYNMGNAPWRADQLALDITLENGEQSPLLDRTTYTLADSVSPNTSALFSLNFTAGTEQRQVLHTVVLRHGSTELMRFNQVVTVISPYAGVVISQNFPVAVKNTWRPTVEMTVQNVGSEPWVYPTLKSTDVDGTLSWFYDWSWKDKKTVQTKWTTVKPGETVTFTFKLKPYWKPNTYPHLYKLWTGSQAITLNGQEVYERWTRVDK